MDLKNAQVVGYYSLPSPTLAEHNPAAYNLALQDAPAGAGSCAHCGMGIIHNVIVRSLDGSRSCIGTTCALRVGDESVRRCVREKLTAEQIAARDAKAAELQAAHVAHEAARKAARAERGAKFLEEGRTLLAQGTDFHRSLASQMCDGPLSDRQAEYVCKAMFGRYSKKVAAEWDALSLRLQDLPAEVSV